MKKTIAKFFAMVAALCTIFTCSGCKSKQSKEKQIVVRDMLGVQTTFDRVPQKIACVSRGTYDLMIAFGLGDIVDGVYKPVLDNEWAQVFYPESINQYKYAYIESYETFLSRGIDLVFAPEAYIADDLRKRGINAMTVSLYGNPSFDDYVFYFADLCRQLWGDREGVLTKIDTWTQQLELAQNKISTELKKHNDPKRKVYYVRGDKNKGIGYTDQGKSFVEYAYRFLNCEYLGSRFGSTTPSVEEICNANPDVFVVGGIYQETLINLLATTEPYVNLTAVKNKQVFNIPIGLTMFEQLSAMSPIFFYDQANKLYPVYFNFDVASLTSNLVEQFFNITLTQSEINNMLSGLSREGHSLA